jgi:MYXO-CTERM domain-containing protein
MVSADDQQGVMEIYSTEMAAAKVGCSVSQPGSSNGGTLAGMVVGLAGVFSARTRRRAQRNAA